LIDFDSEFTQAIESAVGGQLYHVVVDSNETVRELIQNRSFRERTNYLPLNKIQSRPCSKAVIEKAKSIAESMGGSVYYARDIVKSVVPGEYEQIIDFAFGNFFIVDHIDVANKIGFNREINCMVVTLDGDKVEPQGFASGGFNSNNYVSVFKKWGIFKTFKPELLALESSISKVKDEIDILTSNIQQKEILLSREQTLIQKQETVKAALRQCSDVNASFQRAEIEKRIENDEIELEDLKLGLGRASEDLNQIISTLKTTRAASGDQGFSSDIIKKEMSKITEEIDRLDDQLRKSEKDSRMLKESINGSEDAFKRKLKEKESAETKIKKIAEEIENKKTELKSLIEGIGDKSSFKNQLSSKIEKLEFEALHQQKILSELFEQIKIAEDELEKNLEAKESTFDSKMKAEREIEQLLKKNPSLRVETSLDNILGNESYDSISKSLNVIKSRISDLLPKLNMQAGNKKESLLEKIQDLNQKKNILQNDKEKLKIDLSTLDTLSRQAYENCFEAVNKNLSVLFSKLLPHAAAKMVAVPDGVEIKIAFNNKWKDSLSELSGGQRSLLALSLLLSMLKYKSAPFYILDEIDAAMDLSHTENIGQIIADNFGGSQFLVISLKKGMYESSNLLFRTALIEGVSTVERIKKIKENTSDIN